MQLYAETRGTGTQPVLLLHGFLGSGRNLASLGACLLEKHPHTTIHRPDLPGHGRSGGLSEGASLWDMASEVLEYTRGFKGPWKAVGHSLGGRVALAMTLQDPSWASHVTFLDISPSGVGNVSMALSDTHKDIDAVVEALEQSPTHAPTRDVFKQHFMERGISQALTEWLLTNVAWQENGYSWKFNIKALTAFHRRTRSDDLWDVFKHTHVRFSCVRGGLSHFVSQEDVERLKQVGCHTDTVPHAGHFIHADALPEVCRLVVL